MADERRRFAPPALHWFAIMCLRLGAAMPAQSSARAAYRNTALAMMYDRHGGVGAMPAISRRCRASNRRAALAVAEAGADDLAADASSWRRHQSPAASRQWRWPRCRSKALCLIDSAADIASHLQQAERQMAITARTLMIRCNRLAR